MKESFILHSATRQNVLNAIKELSLGKLNKVPTGYNNSIAWNVAHIVVTQQLLHYMMSNQPMLVSEELVAQYRKGTHVEAPISEEDWKTVLNLLRSQPERLQEDYEKQIFNNFNYYPTSYGFELNNIEEAILFNNVHEALHLGYIMAMKKLL